MTPTLVARAAASTVAAAIGLASFAPTATASPEATVLSPGGHIAVYSPEGALRTGCTVGWLASDSQGLPMLLTAGHCGAVGDHVVGRRADGTYFSAGWVTHVVDVPDGEDIAVASISPDAPLDTRVAGLRPVAGAVKRVAVGERVCLYGSKTKKRSCGEVLSVSPSVIQATAKVQPGDSGAPVYAIDRTGVAYPVGILRGMRADSSGAVIQPIIDVLREQGLTLMPTPAPDVLVRPGGR